MVVPARSPGPGRGPPHQLPAMGRLGHPIVLVHGFVESADTWQYTPARLAAAGHRVYALDLDGWGYSQRVAPFTAEHQTTQPLDFIAALHLHGPCCSVIPAAQRSSPWQRCADRPAVGAVMFLDGDERRALRRLAA